MIVAVVCSGCATAFTDRIDNVTGTTALVAGHAITNTGGGQVEFWAQYRADLGVRLRDGAQHDLDDPNSSSQIWAEMSGLQRSTTYHFRICAQDSQQSGGLGYGEDRTFTTTNLECGDVITHDFILSGSMTCLKSFATPGLVIGADGVDINLNGASLTGLSRPSATPRRRRASTTPAATTT